MSDSRTVALHLDLTAEIVAAHVGNNATPADVLPELIQTVYRTLATAVSGAASATAPAEKPKPAVAVTKSVFPDYIVCLEDGKKLKTLRRHLQTAYQMTPNAYRAKWGLPASYPMVAPNYASRRSELAKSIGLGGKKAAEPTEPPVIRIPARRARGSRG